MRYHLIGIKGMGMSALALILKKQGHVVQGSDIEKHLATEDKLRLNNIVILPFNHVDFNMIDIVIIGHSFIAHEEASLARMLGLEIYEYHQYLSLLIDMHKCSVAIAGSHGKTTTTWLMYNTLKNLSHVSALIGDGEGGYDEQLNLIIAETCEYQRHFLQYYPEYAVILNIDLDHVDYFKDLTDYNSAFNEFAVNVKKKVFLNYDNELTRNLKVQSDKKITFGLLGGDYQLVNYGLKDGNYHFAFKYHDHVIIEGKCLASGPHILDHLAAVLAVSHHLNYEMGDIVKNLPTMRSVRRRFEETILANDIYIDDYAHHPYQISETIKFVKEKYPECQVIAFYQPDRYSRVRQFYKEIAASLLLAHRAFVCDFPSTSSNDTDEEFTASCIIDDSEPRLRMFDIAEIRRLNSELSLVFLFLSSKTMDKVIKKVKNERHKLT